MKIVGCDLHTRYQQIAMLGAETGELTERRLKHESGQARAFYAWTKGGQPELLRFSTKGVPCWPMPRRGRCLLPEVPCHVTQRGVDRRETFSGAVPI